MNNPNQRSFLKTLAALLFIVFFTINLSGQERERINRLGVRASYKNDGVSYYGAEISYQIYLKGIRRLEVGIGGMSSNTWDIWQNTYIYQWCLFEKGGFTFYTGPGAGFGFASYGYGELDFYGVLAADIGIDYTFRWPFQIAIDYRPELSAWQEQGNDFSNQLAFAIRLAF